MSTVTSDSFKKKIEKELNLQAGKAAIEIHNKTKRDNNN